MPKSVRLAVLAAMSAAILIPTVAVMATSSGDVEATAPPPGTFKLVGHDPLLARGMNAALAVNENYAYIGSRTDGNDAANSNNAGVMIVDISDPSSPELVNQMGPPNEGLVGESSRELRVWRSQDILIVLHTNCGGAGAHECASPSFNNFRFYDISGDKGADPELIGQLNHNTHEFFLWEDPANPDRALMYGGNATGQGWQIWDLSPLRDGLLPTRIFNGNHGYTQPTGGLHSFSVTNDGKRAMFALLAGGFAVADVSDFSAGIANPQYRQITARTTRPRWPGPGAHSAVKLWNKEWAYVSDEVYGTATASGHGCPWGWARFLDISDPVLPVVKSEFKLPENELGNCPMFEPRPRTSFSAHNPTLTPSIALSTWHSSGMQAIAIDDPMAPHQLAAYLPEPLDQVGLEDPRLSSDPADKVVMWSYPVVQDGLIYVVDLRNGFYVLDYEGPFADEIEDATFLESNSNLGHALCYEPVGEVAGYCRFSEVRRELLDLGTQPSQAADKARRKAAEALAESTRAAGWESSLRLESALGRDVFDGAFKAVEQLKKVAGTAAQAAEIAATSGRLAESAVAAAEAGEAKDAAMEALARGDAQRAAGNNSAAIASYRKAWALVSETT
jgi:hypothetical protein